MHRRDAKHTKTLEKAPERCKISQNRTGQNLEKVPKMCMNTNMWSRALVLKHPNCSWEKAMQQKISDSFIRRNSRVTVPWETRSSEVKGRREIRVSLQQQVQPRTVLWVSAVPQMDWGGMRHQETMSESGNMRLESKQICLVGQLQDPEVPHKIHVSSNVTIFSKPRQTAIPFFNIAFF